MKKLLLLTIAIITLNSCSSNSDENSPNLSFNIESGDRFASSEINAINTSTNYTGGYIWEVSSIFGNETFTTQNLTFNANRVSDYTIKLKTNSNTLETEQIVAITQPSRLSFNKVTLKDIPQNYNSLYFKIYEINLSGNSYIYTSQEQQNISSLVPSVVSWNINLPNNIIQLTDGSDFSAFQIEFYDENDILVTKINSFGNLYDANSQYIAEETELTTVTDCTGCDYFEILADFTFIN